MYTLSNKKMRGSCLQVSRWLPEVSGRGGVPALTTQPREGGELEPVQHQEPLGGTTSEYLVRGEVERAPGHHRDFFLFGEK